MKFSRTSRMKIFYSKRKSILENTHLESYKNLEEEYLESNQLEASIEFAKDLFEDYKQMDEKINRLKNSEKITQQIINPTIVSLNLSKLSVWYRTFKEKLSEARFSQSHIADLNKTNK